MSTNKPCVLQIGRLHATVEEGLQCGFQTVKIPAPPADEPPLDEATAAQVEALVTTAANGLPARWLEALPRLRVVSSFGVGTDKLPLDACRARGIAVGYTPDVLNDCVADTAMAGLLTAARQVCAADRFVREGQWPRGPFALTTQVSGKRLGILGLGRIGQTIARRASGFDMAIAYTSRRPVPGVPWRHEDSLTALAQWADFLVLSVSGGAPTRHMVNEAVLQALGPHGILVNVARGSVVDEAALVRCLQSGELGGAALDVFENEPHVPSALMALPHVVLMPHMASGTVETRQRMADLVLSNLHAGLSGEPMISP
ncbi:MAG TPA: 2-hydroxyacid dehydrogenase [Hydrogenophaga sp.]|nr:2-hydroxyacid dehydrogenase [Hydrogenophaga sp.]